MKDLLNEMDRMKGLFGYKRGVVISEQIPFANTENTNATNVNTFNPAAQYGIKGTKVEEYPECVRAFGNPTPNKTKTQYSINGTGEYKGYQFYTNTGDNLRPKGRVLKPDGEMGDYQCFNNKILIDNKEITKPATQETPTATATETKKQKNIFDIVQSEKNPTTGKNYVWKEVRHAYQLEKQPSTPEGSIQTNTQLQKDWLAGWRPGQQKKTTTDVKPAEKIPLVPTNQTSNQPADDEDVATPQIQVPQQVTNYMAQQQKVIANVDPNDYYKTLYNAGLIQGEGGNRVRYRGPELSKDQQDKLTQAMTNLGYEFYRKGNDKRLVYRKK